jgi:phosphatidate cytidylyltransferase
MSDLLAEPLVRLFLGLFAFLAVATLTGRVLARRGGDTATLSNVTSRIDSWWAMIAILALIFLAGKVATILLFALVSFWCLREFISLTPTRASDHYTLAAAFYLFLPAQYVLLWDGWLSVFTIAIPVYAYLLLPVISVLRGETEDFLLRISKIQWALMLAVYCLSHAPALLMLRIEDYPVGPFGLLAFLLLIVQASDVLQYVFGKLFGKRRLAPLVSPNKTWEGLILGAGAATLLGGALHGLTPFGFTGALAMAAVITLAGALGGLVLSAVKRSLGAKDWGTMIEGHGGMLDRMDSIVFAAPLFFHLTNYFYAP